MCHICGKLLYFLNNGSFIVQNFQNSEYRKPQGGGLYGSCKAKNPTLLFQTLPNSSKLFQTLPNSSKLFQTHPNSFRTD